MPKDTTVAHREADRRTIAELTAQVDALLAQLEECRATLQQLGEEQL
ncbi:hypothetical protein K6U06_19740 [Acidiferrimicrobium sp. IK]|nr:hypothetical protein [Acidiferrimicrobium sp. IK]MCU4186607.1 hypothetical protein [Acidiferrimicrobium sp. IK]